MKVFITHYKLIIFVRRYRWNIWP